MTNKERFNAIMHYKKADRVPLIHFSYWLQTMEKWHQEGHITADELQAFKNGDHAADNVSDRLGFDFYNAKKISDKGIQESLYPPFDRIVLENMPNGLLKVRETCGMIVLEAADNSSIPMEVDYILKDRKAWEEYYLPKLQDTEDRYDFEEMKETAEAIARRGEPLGLYCKSMFGQVRSWMGFAPVSYLYADDEELYDEIIDTIGNLSFRLAKRVFEAGFKPDFIHFWEDICFKNGPLVTPSVFAEKCGPHYKRITELGKQYNVDISSVDCDGMIDSLIPIWLENGVNTMFPIEVGTWNGSIAPWREKYGTQIRGIGGINKKVFALDRTAIDAEIERLKPLVALGGYIPCIDHSIPPDAIWENVQYFCDRFHKTF